MYFYTSKTSDNFIRDFQFLLISISGLDSNRLQLSETSARRPLINDLRSFLQFRIQQICDKQSTNQNHLDMINGL